MPHWVIVGLPEGGTARADFDDPIVPVMRRINACRAERRDGDPGDYEKVRKWREKQLAAGNMLAARPVSRDS